MNHDEAMQTVMDLSDEAIQRLMAEAEPDRDLRARFERFHKANPFVYDELVRLARRAKMHGQERLGIAMLFEVLRYEVIVGRDPREDFKLNNDYRSFYARLIMEQEPDLDGFFETRRVTWRNE